MIMKKFILGAMLVFSVVSCTVEPGKDGVNGKDSIDGSNATATGGKQFIFITGNITNEQAAAKIAQELGANTDRISISYTVGLTALDLSALATSWEISIANNQDLTTVNLNGLKTTNDLYLGYNNKLQTVLLNNLTSAN